VDRNLALELLEEVRARFDRTLGGVFALGKQLAEALVVLL